MRLSSFLRPHLMSDQSYGSDHPDPNLLSAFAEENLSPREHASILTHLARCAECRQILALSSTANAFQPPSPHRFAAKNTTWWGLRLAAMAGVICLAIATIWRPALFTKTPASTQRQTPVSVSSPSHVSTQPLSAKAIETATTKPGMSRKKQVSHPREVTTFREPSLHAPLPKASAEAEKSSVSMIASPQPGQAASPQSALVPQTHPAAPGAQPTDILEPKSMSGVLGGVVSAQKFARATQANEKTFWSLRISPRAGTVQRSEDGGRTWLTIPIDETTEFYALSQSGSDVWVGGGSGKLFHSVDNGVHWTAVPVRDEESNLSDAILKIDTRGQSITLKTPSGAIWVTEDGAAHWRRQ